MRGSIKLIEIVALGVAKNYLFILSDGVKMTVISDYSNLVMSFKRMVNCEVRLSNLMDCI